MITREELFLQEFNGPCVRCSQDLEDQKIFQIYLQKYSLSIFGKRIPFYKKIKIFCGGCRFTVRLPEITARKIFKNGLKSSSILILLKKNRIITNDYLVFFASLWNIFLLILFVNISFVLVKFYFTPIVVGDLEISDPSDLVGNKLMGKIVRVKIKADLTQAFMLDELNTNAKDNRLEPEFKSREIYFPIFIDQQNSSFAIFRGGREYIEQAVSITNSTPDYKSLRNVEVELVGKVRNIDSLGNQYLRDFYFNTYAKENYLNPPGILIDGSRLQTSDQFIKNNYQLVLMSFVFALASMILSIYLDSTIRRIKYH